jgi:Trk-type K+ transport system membrane component
MGFAVVQRIGGFLIVVSARITNLGPALGLAGPTCAGLNHLAKVIPCVAMLPGRTIHTLPVLLTPACRRG